MKEILLRIYRTHDYDLMMLHHSRLIHIGRAAEQAVTAYYKGDYFRYQIQTGPKYMGKLPSQSTFLLVFKETDAPGLMEWLSGFSDGCRNSFIKNVLRTYLDSPLWALYRNDMWQALDRNYSSEPVIPPVLARKKGRPMGDSVAARSHEKRGKGITQPDHGLMDADSTAVRSQSTSSIPPPMPDYNTKDKSKPIIENAVIPDSEFDAFSMFNQLRNGE